MTDKPKTEYIIIKETALQSIISDVFTFGLTAALICLGVWLDSTALELLGSFSFLISLSANARGFKRLTREQAIAKIEGLDK